MGHTNRLLPVLFLAACGNQNPKPADDCVAAGTCPMDMATPRPMPDIALTCSPGCAAPTPYCNDALHCVPCLVDAHCPAGQVCEKRGDLSLCVEGCADDSRCQRDGGATMACCDKHCVDTTSDPANCGGCGKVCTGTHGQAACGGSQCQTGKCDTGWGDCNNDPKDGCETNVHVDPANCGACGMTCSIPNAVTACSDGCYLAACNFGWADCNGDPSDGCELDVTNDMKNCGGCGLLCNNKPRAKNSCIASSCVVIACDPGYADCNGDTSDGCEVGTATDLKNCGKCGNVCAQGLVCSNGACTCPQCNIPNAKSKCINNQCALESCVAGYGNCDNDPKNGCEINLNSDAANCGACGNACPMDAPKCSSGKCLKALQYVGEYNCGDGPDWWGNPETYTCQEACALQFGGAAAEYACSTVMGMVDHQANTSSWGVPDCQIAAEDFKKSDFYDCGWEGCAQSAYVSDNCFPGTNYCYK